MMIQEIVVSSSIRMNEEDLKQKQRRFDIEEGFI
jgi:hypothetical protein